MWWVCGLYPTHSIRCTQCSTRNNQLSYVLQQHLMLSHSNRCLTLLTRSARVQTRKMYEMEQVTVKTTCACVFVWVCETMLVLRAGDSSLNLCLSVSLTNRQNLSLSFSLCMNKYYKVYLNRGFCFGAHNGSVLFTQHIGCCSSCTCNIYSGIQNSLTASNDSHR